VHFIPTASPSGAWHSFHWPQSGHTSRSPCAKVVRPGFAAGAGAGAGVLVGAPRFLDVLRLPVLAVWTSYAAGVLVGAALFLRSPVGAGVLDVDLALSAAARRASSAAAATSPPDFFRANSTLLRLSPVTAISSVHLRACTCANLPPRCTGCADEGCRAAIIMRAVGRGAVVGAWTLMRCERGDRWPQVSRSVRLLLPPTAWRDQPRFLIGAFEFCRYSCTGTGQGYSKGL
jgi:hypothetical protein